MRSKNSVSQLRSPILSYYRRGLLFPKKHVCGKSSADYIAQIGTHEASHDFQEETKIAYAENERVLEASLHAHKDHCATTTLSTPEHFSAIPSSPSGCLSNVLRPRCLQVVNGLLQKLAPLS